MQLVVDAFSYKQQGKTRPHSFPVASIPASIPLKEPGGTGSNYGVTTAGPKYLKLNIWA